VAAHLISFVTKTFLGISHVQNVRNIPRVVPVVAVLAGPVAVLGTAVLPGLPPEQQLCVKQQERYLLFFFLHSLICSDNHNKKSFCKVIIS